jgi:hypothetical protein
VTPWLVEERPLAHLPVPVGLVTADGSPAGRRPALGCRLRGAGLPVPPRRRFAVARLPAGVVVRLTGAEGRRSAPRVVAPVAAVGRGPAVSQMLKSSDLT